MKNSHKHTKKLIEGDYDLELDRIIKTIKKQKAGLVCIQLPDGLKQKATNIAEFIEQNTKAKVLIWLGSCFGACDIPNFDKIKPKIDLFIQFGHSSFGFPKRNKIKER